jgi:hypothetical protein
MGVKRYDIATAQWVDYRPVVNQGNNTVPNIPAKRVFRSVYYQNPEPTGDPIHVWQLIGDYVPPEVAPSGVGVMSTTPMQVVGVHNLYGFWTPVSVEADDRYKYNVQIHFMDSNNTLRAQRFAPQAWGSTQGDLVSWDPTVWGNFIRARFWYLNLNGVGPYSEGTLTLPS